MTVPVLREYQSNAIERLRQSLRNGKRRPVLQLPTGGGKTIIAGEIIANSLRKGNRVIFAVPAISLIDQAIQSFWKHGIREVGVMQADHPLTDPTKPVQVASIQTLARRGKPIVGLAIVDEVHKQYSAMNDWLAGNSMVTVPVIGLSATPWARGMGKHWDDLIVCATTAEMIDQGHLCSFRAFAPAHPDLSNVKIVAGDFHEKQLGEAMNKPILVADIVETWLRMGEGRPTFCFAVDCAHAQSLQERFIQAGITCGYIDAYTDPYDRETIKRAFHRGEYKVVCNVGCLTMGVDWDVRCIILARPTKSEILYVQMIGRGLRTADGKDDCLILDHSDSTINLGFVTDIHHSHLDDGKPKNSVEKKKPLPKECPKCHSLRAVGLKICPICGFEAVAKSHIEAEDGELVEISRKGKKSEGPPNHIRIGGIWIPFGDFYAQLKCHARERGFKGGWASNQYKDALGVWPNAYKSVPEKAVGYEVNAWIKSRLIRFIKRREKTTPQAVAPTQAPSTVDYVAMVSQRQDADPFSMMGD